MLAQGTQNLPTARPSRLARLSGRGWRRRQPQPAELSGLPTVVLVGGGMAAHRFCRQMATRGGLRKYRLVMCTSEPRPPYDRVKLTEFFQTCDPDHLLLDPLTWYRDQAIDLRLGDPIVQLDPQKQIVQAASGTRLHYDYLVLATGSRPFVPPMPGTDLDGVFVYRTIEDLQAILAHSQVARRAAVIGGGLLGLEAARALHELGLATVVVEMAQYLMPRQLDLESAALLLEEVTRLGVQVLLGQQTSHIEPYDSGLRLCFREHDAIPVDLIVISAGITPHGELAAAAGLQCHPRGAVLVDDTLQTSVPHIYAIGECAAHQGQIYGLVAPAYVMADVVVDRLLGKQSTFTGVDLSTRLKLLGVDVTVLGEYLQPGTTLIYRGPGVYRKLVLKNNRLVGVIAVGPWAHVGRIQAAVQARRHLGQRVLARFVVQGELWTQTEPPIQQWPDKAIVCNCCRVTKAVLQAAYHAGATSPEALASATGASTVCGSCRPLLVALAGTSMLGQTPQPGFQGLQWVAMLGLVAALLLLTLPPLPVAESIQAWWYDLDDWRRQAFTRQVTGYTLLAGVLAALGLSFRKRWTRLTWGRFSSWRLVHALLGVGTLVGLVVHTGLRFGSNLNFVLMSVFVALNLLGTLAAWVSAIEGRGTGRAMAWARRWRPRLTLLHIVLFWPFPALIAFHILAAYYF